MMNFKSRRFGRFYIYFDSIENDCEFVRQIMGEVIVLKTEVLFHMDSMEYVAISKHFDEVEDGIVIPEYKAIIHSEDGFQRFEKC